MNKRNSFQKTIDRGSHETLALLHLAGFAAHEGAPGAEFITTCLWDAPLSEIERRLRRVYRNVGNSFTSEKRIKYSFLEKFYFCRSIFDQCKDKHYEAATLLLRDGEISSQGIKELFERWGTIDGGIISKAWCFAVETAPQYFPEEAQANLEATVS